MLNETETAPIGSTMTPRQVRYIKISIVIMTILLIAGFILLIVGLFMRAGTSSEKADTASKAPVSISQDVPALLSLPVAAGTNIASVQTDQGRLIIHLRQPGGGEIAIINLATGQEVQRIRLAPAN